jgi:oligopeptidase A
MCSSCIHQGRAYTLQAKERFNAIAEELTQLSTTFSNNVLDSTKAFSKLLTSKADVDGLPASALALMAQQAQGKGHEAATPEDGPWLVTLDIPSYLPVQLHAKSRSLREEVYRAYITRASVGDSDNTPILMSILRLRKEKAALLGYTCHAEVSMASKVCSAGCPLSWQTDNEFGLVILMLSSYPHFFRHITRFAETTLGSWASFWRFLADRT